MAKKPPSLMEKMLATAVSPYARPITDSLIFKRDMTGIPTDIPLLDIALSGEVGKGLLPGILIIAGESRRFKTLFGLYLVSAFQRKYSDGIVLFFDTEFGTPPAYLNSFGLDLSRVVHMPCSCVEDLRHEMAAQLAMLKENKKTDEDAHVMIFVDSIGNLASRKEIDDAVEGNDKADMTRAKALKSFFRIVTTDLQILGIPFVGINHVYKSTGTFVPTDIVGGGSGVQLAADNIWVIGRSQEKEGSQDTKKLVGYEFTINVYKSRFVKEKSRLPITVHWKTGIHRYSGLADLALKFGVITSDKDGKTTTLSCKSTTVPEKNNDMNKDFWETVLQETDLKDLIKREFCISNATIVTDATEGDGDDE
jgi:RecA/RadA recombinase